MLLQVIEVSKSYGNVKAVDKVSFSIEKGEILALLGPNGAGKTTLLRIIAEGLIHTGKVLLEGKEISEMRWKIGYMPQDSLLYEDLSAADNIKFYAMLKKVPLSKGITLMKGMKIPNKKVRKLSGGMRRRLSVAIALLGEPSVLVLDEPTTGLDVESRHEIWKIIRRAREEGRGILLTTHYMEEAEELADRVAIIHRGRIIAMNIPENLKKMAGIRSAIVARGNFETVPEGFIKEKDSVIKFSRNPREELPEVVRTLSRVGEVKEISVREPTLEDVFLKLTGRGLT